MKGFIGQLLNPRQTLEFIDQHRAQVDWQRIQLLLADRPRRILDLAVSSGREGMDPGSQGLR
ncbi:hypothetical protein KR52_09065 [Synechococcus sp. KORDI-52]|uniref:hypothetical protein n=1 Tax=Synechococcus sp. KORDI-52 TaxID=585425 RepID=UPI0004E032DF|nr:hypothetical protein [Synechococcus sp. KORDI-52]AII49293.1 hypothetical protein KR52_09065 [Synechococcus sp. KORDI-52]